MQQHTHKHTHTHTNTRTHPHPIFISVSLVQHSNDVTATVDESLCKVPTAAGMQWQEKEWRKGGVLKMRKSSVSKLGQRVPSQAVHSTCLPEANGRLAEKRRQDRQVKTVFDWIRGLQINRCLVNLNTLYPLDFCVCVRVCGCMYVCTDSSFPWPSPCHSLPFSDLIPLTISLSFSSFLWSSVRKASSFHSGPIQSNTKPFSWATDTSTFFHEDNHDDDDNRRFVFFSTKIC